jgi:hypothetical protein
MWCYTCLTDDNNYVRNSDSSFHNLNAEGYVSGPIDFNVTNVTNPCSLITYDIKKSIVATSWEIYILLSLQIQNLISSRHLVPSTDFLLGDIPHQNSVRISYLTICPNHTSLLLPLLLLLVHLYTLWVPNNVTYNVAYLHKMSTAVEDIQLLYWLYF